MEIETSQDIVVEVQTQYEPRFSSPMQYHYVFAYRITITNKSNHTVQLLRRHWHIIDAIGTHKEVQGDGVVGEQPIIEPSDSYQYVSGSNIKSGIGKMYGYYVFERIIDGKLFLVEIPDFTMVAPFRLN